MSIFHISSTSSIFYVSRFNPHGTVAVWDGQIQDELHPGIRPTLPMRVEAVNEKHEEVRDMKNGPSCRVLLFLILRVRAQNITVQSEKTFSAKRRQVRMQEAAVTRRDMGRPQQDMINSEP
jgi:hypothetical protein